MGEWRKCDLGKILVFGNGKVRPNTEGAVPVYGGNGILGYCDNNNYSDETIIIGRVGAYCGSVYYENRPVWVSDNALSAKPKSNNYAKFLFYFLKNLSLNQFAEGSSHPLVTQTLLNSIEVQVPYSFPEQKAIASVLSSLDDKIDLLHSQNKTLEAMAETLFRQWFVPARAGQPHAGGEEAQEDWEEGKIEDLFLLQRGFDLPIQKRVDGLYPIFAASGHCGTHNESKVKAPGVTTGRSGLLGKVFFIMEDFWPLNTSLFIKEYRIGTPLFSYFLLQTIDLEGFNAGSAVPTLNRNHVHKHNILIPPRALIEKFENLINPSFKKIEFNKTQIRILEKLRDTLLPKLMSGEVRIEM